MREEQQKNWFKRHKVLSTIGVVVIILIGLGAWGGSEPAQQRVQEQELKNNTGLVAEMSVSALQLSDDYDANKVAADAKYKDKVLEISGIVKSIGKDILNTPYVALEGRSTSFFGVQCMFSRANEPELATLSKGQTLTLKGRVTGELVGNVIVNDCTILK